MSLKSYASLSAMNSFAIAACLLLASPAISGQSSQGGSLADAARQVRAQKTGQSDDGASRAQAVAAELSDDQNDSAPGGFKTFNAGDYALWVPAPYKVEGTDSAGVVLSGPMMGVRHALVLVGTPVAAHWQNDDAAFEDTATKFAHLYSDSAHCAKVTIANHTAYQCGLAAANLLGNQVGGNAVFVLGAGNIYPVFCVSPTASRSRDLINNPRASSSIKDWSRETLDREDQDTRRVWQQCDSVFQSFRLKPTAQPVAEQAHKSSGDAARGAALTGPGQTAKLVTTDARLADEAPRAAVVETAARTNQGPAPATETPAVSGSAPAALAAPAGFKAQPFKYCKSQNQCWDASFYVPGEAQLVSSDCGQYAFAIKVKGEPFLLMAGPNAGTCSGRAGNDPNLIRWKDLADPETARAPGTSSTISSLLGSLAGKSASITTIGFRKGLVEWMGKRAEVESNGVSVVVGCMATRDHFYDGDAACSALIESLQLP